jgi:hypothetical protein
MKMSQCLLLLMAGLLVGLFIGGNVAGPSANAQGIPNAVSAPRYQISAWAFAGNPSRPTPEHGCYVVDTMTGELWQATGEGRPQKVSEKLK